tara:strand:+ start:180 stop:545 length:366 start_codon:yes stop_codon:yes gene_type:complete
MTVYVSSKLKHKDMWLGRREEGLPVISSWIDGEKIEGGYALDMMWERYLTEISEARYIIVYVEPGDILKGALIELGAALYKNIPVYVVWDGSIMDLEKQVGTWIHYRTVTIVQDIGQVDVG